MKSYLAILLISLTTIEAAKIPKSWITCKQGSTQNDCLRGAIEGAIKELTRGLPSLGVFPMDPLRFNSIGIDQGTGPVQIKLDFQNLDLIGMKDLKVLKVVNDWNVMNVTALIPRMVLLGEYSINGKVLILPITGKGNCNLTFDGFKPTASLTFDKITKGGKTYFNNKKFEFIINTDHLTMHFGNLFNGDKALGDNMNVFLNENWNEILNELKPAISRAFGAAFKDISNRIFSKIPADILAPK